MCTPRFPRPMPRRIRGRRLNATDFRRLELDLCEARVAVIRHAAGRTASSLVAQNAGANAPAVEAELARLVTSVYRLLDPRRREELAERVQLLQAEPSPIPIGGAWNPPQPDADRAAPRHDPQVDARRVPSRDGSGEVASALAAPRIDLAMWKAATEPRPLAERLARHARACIAPRPSRLNACQRLIAGAGATTVGVVAVLVLMLLWWWPGGAVEPAPAVGEPPATRAPEAVQTSFPASYN